MAFKIDGFVALTGGGTGALDKISVADKQTNDAALGVVSSVFYVYRYNSASSATEDSPNIIAPDSGTGCWELVFMVDTDTAMTADADNRTPSQKAVKYYIDGLIDAANGLVYKGAIDCSVSPFPNYPTANAGHCYVVSGAGRVGGESGELVEIGDMLLCKTDSSAEGDQATVGTNWDIIQKNMAFPITVAQGGTGVATLTDRGVLLGSGTDPIMALGAMTNGQLVIGSTGADPVVASITDGEGIDTTKGAGTLTIACEDASESNKGVTVYAGNTKAIAGTDTASAMTPDDLKFVLGHDYTYPIQEITEYSEEKTMDAAELAAIIGAQDDKTTPVAADKLVMLDSEDGDGVKTITIDNLKTGISTPTPAASVIPRTDGSGKLDTWVSDATTAVKGKLVTAGNAKALAGADTASAMTPDDLKFVLGHDYTYPIQEITEYSEAQ